MAIKTSKTQHQHIQHTDNPADKVLVTPKDGDRFVLSVPAALLGCHLAVRLEGLDKPISALFEILKSWLNERAERLDRAVFSSDQDGFILTLVQKGRVFDPDLHEQAAELDMAIACDEDFDLIKFRVIVVPSCTDETIASFVDLSHPIPLLHA